MSYNLSKKICTDSVILYGFGTKTKSVNRFTRLGMGKESIKFIHVFMFYCKLVACYTLFVQSANAKNILPNYRRSFKAINSITDDNDSVKEDKLKAKHQNGALFTLLHPNALSDSFHYDTFYTKTISISENKNEILSKYADTLQTTSLHLFKTSKVSLSNNEKWFCNLYTCAFRCGSKQVVDTILSQITSLPYNCRLW